MAYTALTVQKPTDDGAALTFSDAETGTGNSFSNDGRTYVEVHNNGTDTATATFTKSGKAFGESLAAASGVALTADQRKVLGPFDPRVYNVVGGANDGDVLITYSGAGSADIDVAAFK